MKRWIHASSTEDRWVAVKNLKITVVYEESDELPTQSTIEPLKDSNGVYSAIALSEYESFLISALDIFDDHDFEVIQEKDSPYSQSYYAAFVKKDQIEDADYKYILFVRLSDHANNKATYKGKQAYYRDLAEKLKQPTAKTKQLWKLKEIVVNNKTFDSYDAALLEIDKLLRQYD